MKNESIIFVIPKILPFNGLDKFWISLNVTNNISKAVIIFSYSILNNMYFKYSDSKKYGKLTRVKSLDIFFEVIKKCFCAD